MHNFPTTIVDAHWLQQNLHNPNLVILHAGAGKPNTDVNDQPAAMTIAHARYFDLNLFKDNTSPFPNTAPTAELFSLECQKLGINKDSYIVVFDELGVYYSPRVWWLFNLMGHKQIAVLDGGLPSWQQQNLPVVALANCVYQDIDDVGDFCAVRQSELLVDFDAVLANSKNQKFSIVDARSSGRFDGLDAEPRQHLKSGSIPHSVNVPFKSVLEDGKFKDTSSLQAIFSKQANHSEKLVFSCGSGMTACIIMLAYNIAFADSKKLYDGSWTEWAELNQLTTA